MMNEIFRHIRPCIYDQTTHVIVKDKMGGMGFLLEHTDIPNQCNFWIYICPFSKEYKQKEAIKYLREKNKKGIVPFGTIQLGEGTIETALIKFIMNEETELESQTGKLMMQILLKNNHAEFEFLNKTKHYASSTDWDEYSHG
jgi:hypothetical protein